MNAVRILEISMAPGEHEVVIAFDTAAGAGWGICFSWGEPAGKVN